MTIIFYDSHDFNGNQQFFVLHLVKNSALSVYLFITLINKLLMMMFAFLIDYRNERINLQLIFL